MHLQSEEEQNARNAPQNLVNLNFFFFCAF